MNAVDTIYYSMPHYEGKNLDYCVDIGGVLQEMYWLADTLDSVLPMQMTEEYTVEYAVNKLLGCVSFYCNPHELALSIQRARSMKKGVSLALIVNSVIDWSERYKEDNYYV